MEEEWKKLEGIGEKMKGNGRKGVEGGHGIYVIHWRTLSPKIAQNGKMNGIGGAKLAW